jgi:hypothetical protein
MIVCERAPCTFSPQHSERADSERGLLALFPCLLCPLDLDKAAAHRTICGSFNLRKKNLVWAEYHGRGWAESARTLRACVHARCRFSVARSSMSF